jgi:Lrp/AsnC family leucine-responsive transcriptional regulator
VRRVRYRNGGLDAIDARILQALADDARIAMKDLAREVGLSAPSVAERVRRLEENGVIAGYGAKVDPAAVGLPLAVCIRVRPMPGEVKRMAALLAAMPAIVECDRVTGDDCFVAKAHLASVEELERIIDAILPYGITHTSVIQSTPVRRRLPAFAVAPQSASASATGRGRSRSTKWQNAADRLTTAVAAHTTSKLPVRS